MALYFLDHENIGSQGLKGIELLTKNDEIIIFTYPRFGLNSKIVKILEENNVKYKLISQTIHTKNSLDFKIVAYIGMEIGKGKNKEFVILSKDNGYSAAMELFKEKNVKIVEAGTIKKGRSKLSQAIPSENLEKVIKENNLTKNKEEIINAFNEATTLAQLHNKLQKIQNNKVNIYALIKPIYKKSFAK